MSSQESPQDIDSWIAYLKDKPLPVRVSIQQRLQHAVQSDATTLQSLTRLIKSDPLVCLHLVRQANQLHTEKGSAVTSVDHAVHSLGFDRIDKAVKRLNVIRLNAGSVCHKMFFRAVAASHHASVQAYTWVQERNSVFAEESQLASLFYGIGHWMMWLHAPLHMSNIQIKVREQGIDVVLAETDVLGCTLQEISYELAKAWELPELTLESLDHDTSPNRDIIDLMHRRALKDPTIEDEERRALKHMVQQKFFPVKLSNWLAITATFGWQQKKTKQLYTIISDYLGENTAEMVGRLHTNCAESARAFNVPGTLSPATELLMLESNLHPNYKIMEKEIQTVAQDCPKPVKIKNIRKAAKAAEQGTIQTAYTPVEIAFKNELLFKKLAAAFLKGSPQIKTPAHVLQCVVKALYEGLGMQQVVLHRVNKRHLISALSAGIEKEHPLNSYQFNLEIPSIFKRLCDKPGCIWITPQTREQMLRSLPESYHPHVPETGAVLMSIFSGEQPVAIVHTDNVFDPIDEFHHKRTRYICSAATQALHNLRTASRQPS